MSRHTLNDGKTPDLRIKNFDVHIPILGPSPKLIGRYCRNEIGWGMFEHLYLAEIRQDRKAEYVKHVAMIAYNRDMTLMCIEECADKCHRRLLAEECVRLVSGLIIKHL